MSQRLSNDAWRHSPHSTSDHPNPFKCKLVGLRRANSHPWGCVRMPPRKADRMSRSLFILFLGFLKASEKSRHFESVQMPFSVALYFCVSFRICSCVTLSCDTVHFYFYFLFIHLSFVMVSFSWFHLPFFVILYH